MLNIVKSKDIFRVNLRNPTLYLLSKISIFIN